MFDVSFCDKTGYFFFPGEYLLFAKDCLTHSAKAMLKALSYTYLFLLALVWFGLGFWGVGLFVWGLWGFGLFGFAFFACLYLLF